MPADTTPAPSNTHDDDDDDVSDSCEDSDDEELRLWYEEEWAQHDHVPYVSGGLPDSFMDSEEEPLWVGGKCIFALCGGETPASLFDVEEEPLWVGGMSIFTET